MERWATFDCYGTLIDWETGIRDALASVWPGADVEALAERYHEIEPKLQAGRGVPYRTILTEALRRLATEERIPLPPRKGDALAASLPSWRAFPEVPGALDELRRRGWRLAILSNTDPDYLAASLLQIGVPVDLRIVASEIGSYKPAFGHWEAFFRATGAARPAHVHVAASLFHDIAPCERLGLRAVWINRLGETSGLPRAAELTDLAALPDTLDGLVPVTP